MHCNGGNSSELRKQLTVSPGELNQASFIFLLYHVMSFGLTPRLKDFGHPRAYASVFSFVAPLELDGSSLQCWMEVATWCRVQARCSLSRLPRVHQPRLIFTGSLARVATRAAKEPAQNLIFTIILLVVGIDSLSHQSRITIVPLNHSISTDPRLRSV